MHEIQVLEISGIVGKIGGQRGRAAHWHGGAPPCPRCPATSSLPAVNRMMGAVAAMDVSCYGVVA